MCATRFSDKVIQDCNLIALKIIQGSKWETDWSKLVSQVYTDLGMPSKVPPEGIVDLKEEIEDAIREMEERLSTIGDDAQLANLDMQSILQKQQQTMQMMSQISKLLHDTAMSTIRKIGG